MDVTNTALAGMDRLVVQDMPSMIAERIKQLICEGTLAPGAQLKEVAVAEAFGVSRGPVREAIQRLTQVGLLRTERNRGTFVSELTLADVRDIYLLRASIEVAALERLIEQRTNRAVDELTSIVEDMADAVERQNYDVVDTLDHTFHSRLVRLSGSPRLAHAFDRLSVETRMCLNMLHFSHPDHRDIADWHRSFIEAVRIGDPAAARAAVAFHNSTVLDDLMSSVSDESDP